MAYAALLGIQRAGLIWAPVNARNAIEENLYILDNTDVAFLFYHSSFEHYLPRIREACPKIKTFLCLDAPEFDDWLAQVRRRGARSGRRAGRGRDPDQLGRHDRPAQGRADHQPRDRDHERDLLGHHADRGAAGASDGGADDPRGGRLLVSAAALRRHQHLHGHGRSRRDPGGDREASRDAHLHAADADLHPAGASRHRQIRLQLAAAAGLRLGADVGRQAGRGDRGVRPRADPDLRPGRGLHDRHRLLARGPCRGAREQQAPSAGELRQGSRR